MRFLRLLTLSAFLGLIILPVQAQTNSLMQRDTLLPAVLNWLQQQGSKLTLIGEEGGLRGYLVESPTGKMQSVYVTPDGKHIVAGILLEQGGRNVTGVQIGEMRNRFDDASKSLGSDAASASLISGPTAEQEINSEAVLPAADDVMSTPSVEVAPNPPSVVDRTDIVVEPKVEGVSLGTDLEVSGSTTALVLEPATSTVVGAEGNRSEVWASKIDRDTFLKAAEALPYFEVGSRLAPITLWKVADPKCPFCHSTWDSIRPAVFEKKIKVRVILINALNGSEPYSRELLASPNSSRRWLESNGGRNLEIKVDRNSPEWAKAGDYLQTNMEFARKFKVDRTPFLAYVAPDGRFYSALGLPNDLGGFLAATLIDSK